MTSLNSDDCAGVSTE